MLIMEVKLMPIKKYSNGCVRKDKELFHVPWHVILRNKEDKLYFPVNYKHNNKLKYIIKVITHTNVTLSAIPN